MRCAAEPITTSPSINVLASVLLFFFLFFFEAKLSELIATVRSFGLSFNHPGLFFLGFWEGKERERGIGKAEGRKRRGEGEKKDIRTPFPSWTSQTHHHHISLCFWLIPHFAIDSTDRMGRKTPRGSLFLIFSGRSIIYLSSFFLLFFLFFKASAQGESRFLFFFPSLLFST